MVRIKNKRATILICLGLAIITLATFWPLFHAEFIHFDDPSYVTTNPQVPSGLSWGNVKWAFTSGYASNWHPLTWLSHMLDVQLFGLKPERHHATNVLLHTANVLLLFLALKSMTGALWRSGFAAALFALHPLHVESVAWVAERKDILSGFFFMLTLLAYTKYVRRIERRGIDAKSEVRGQKSMLWYFLALLLFAFGLMSKPMLVTTPFVLLLLDYWPLRRLELKAQNLKLKTFDLVREKLPFFALVIADCLITMRVQTEAMVDPNFLPFSNRLANAAFSYVSYLGQTFWPTHLAVFYPYPLDMTQLQAIGALALVLVITAAVMVLAKRLPYAPVGWLWYLGMLVPVIGLVQVGSQARADRYTYLPLIGIFVLVTWGVTDLWLARIGRSRSAATPLRKGWLAGAAVAIFFALHFGAYHQAEYWRNGRSLFEHARQVTKDNYVAWGGLGIIDLRQTNYLSAMTNLDRALEYARPHGAESGIKYYIGAGLQMQGKGLEALPYLEESKVMSEQRAERSYRLGLSLVEAGRLSEAEAHLKQALDAKPNNADFQLGWAALLNQQGQTNQAEQLFREIATAHPQMAQAHKSFADFLMLRNRPAEAENHYAAALKLESPRFPLLRAYSHALASQGKTKLAAEQLEQALKLEPDNAQANFELAELLSQQNKNREAIACYNQALARDSRLVSALNNLAWMLATDPDDQLRDGSRAVELAQRACQLTEWKHAFLMGTLAAAYAEAGRFNEAVATAEKARDKARADKLEAVAKRNEELLALYRAGKPYHETTNGHQ